MIYKTKVFNNVTKKMCVIKTQTKDIFFCGDIVELINVTLSSHEYEIKQNELLKQRVGMRYKLNILIHAELNVKHDDFDEYCKLFKNSENLMAIFRYICEGYGYVDTYQIRLFKRPFKNWLKYVYLKITNIYLCNVKSIF